MSGNKVVRLAIVCIIVALGMVLLRSVPHKRHYLHKLSWSYSAVRGKIGKLVHRPDRSWVKKAEEFIPSKVLISDFEQQVAGENEWVGINVEINRNARSRYAPVSGKAYLRMRVNAGATGSIEKTFDTPQDFSRHHFQWWMRSEPLDRTDIERPAYHSEIDSRGNAFLEQFYEAYVYFSTDAQNYSRYQFTFPPQYNGWYHVALHRGDTARTDGGKGVDWQRVKCIKFEVKGKSIPFSNADVDVALNTIYLQPKNWGPKAPPLHTGAKAQFTTAGKLPGGLSPSTFYWVHDEGKTGKCHSYKFAASKENLKAGRYVDLTCASDNCSGNAVTRPEVMFDRFEAIETLPIPFITFRFDDNYRNTYLYAKPILDEFGWDGVFAVVTQKENTEGYEFCLDCGKDKFVSYEEVRKMQDDGWDIAVHGFHHRAMGDGTWSGLPDTDDEDMMCYNRDCTEEEFSMGRRILESEGLGKGARFWVWPFGTANSISDIALKLISDYYALGSWCWPKSPAGIPLTNRYTLPIAELNLTQTETQQLASIKNQIDKTCEYGGWLTILFHHIYVADGASHKDEHSTTFLREVCDYIRKKQQASPNTPVVVTFSDMYDNIIAKEEVKGERSKVAISPAPPVTRHSHSFQLLPAEDGLVRLYAAQRSIAVTLPPVARANGRIYTLTVADIVSPHVITVSPCGGETIQGKSSSYTGLNAEGKVMKIKAEGPAGNWIILDAQ
jgi:peptidoglycan/xylan/chitin deacetylase (PgdA/CDA1 family)